MHGGHGLAVADRRPGKAFFAKIELAWTNQSVVAELFDVVG
jgi:hypothetical protein